MAERRLTFPDDHPYHPGKTLVIPEGTSQEELDAQIDELSKPPGPSTGEDVLKSVGTAPARLGIGMAGLPGDVQQFVSKGLSDPEGQAKLADIRKKYGAPVPSFATDPSNLTKLDEARKKYGASAPTSAGIKQGVEGITGPIYEPQTGAGKVADAATQLGIGGILGGGASTRTLPNIGINTASGGLGEYLRQKTEGVKVPESIPYIGGKDISPAVSALTAMFAPVPIRNRLTPSKINPVKQQQYETAVRESGGKFTPTAGQLIGDQAQINAELATNKGKAINQQQKDAFMETATGPTGDPNINVTSRSPDSWVARNMRRTGDNIDNLERTTHIQHPTGNTWLRSGSSTPAFPEFVNIATRRRQDIPGILKVIEQTTGKIPSPGAPAGEEIHNALFNSNGTGRLTGEQYKRLRTNLHSAAEGASNETAHSYRQTANALDNAMSATNPEWGRNWHQARREYANTLVMQEAAKKPGVTQFTPDQLDTATKAVMGKSPHLKGELENSPFIDAAAAFKPLKIRAVPEEPSMIAKAASYVPGGRLAMQWLPAIGGVAGHLAGQHMGWAGGEGLIAGTLLGAEARKRVNVPQSPYMNAMSPISQWHKKNQIAPTPNYSPGMAGMLERSAPAAVRGLIDTQRQNNQ